MPLIAGNWKMHGTTADIAELDAMLAARVADATLLICPPATLIAPFAARARGHALAIGGQDCHAEPRGAHTGDISAEMLADAGARFVIVGHSERRADHGETDPDVRAKAAAAHRAGLCAIVCVGETLAERDAGRTLERIAAQLRGSLPDDASPSRLVIAYEPVWAIGTGRTPTREQIAEVHGAIRSHAGPGVRILYGGSVKPDNAADILALDDVDGALVGGASLKAKDFLAIAGAAQAAGVA
jgi:triosephosphate isomerase